MVGVCALAVQALPSATARAQSRDVYPDYALRLSALSGQRDRQGVDRRRQLGLVSQRLDTTRASRPDERDNINTSSFAIRFAGPSADESAAFETRNHLSPEEARRTERLALWLAGDLTVDRARANDPRLATVHTDGLTFGTDARLGPRLLVGNALGTGFDRTGIGSDGWQGSRYISDTLYASAFTGKQTYLDLAVGAAWTRFDTYYGAAGAGDRGARQLYALARYSRKYATGRSVLVPYGEAGISRTGYGGYTEGGTGLACPAQSARAYHVSMGMRGQTSFATRAGRLEPHAGMDVARTMKRMSAATLAPDDGLRRSIAPSLARTARLAATTGLKWAISENATFDGQYAVTGDLGDFRPGQSVTASFKLRF